jgi:hypothetical protein
MPRYFRNGPDLDSYECSKQTLQDHFATLSTANPNLREPSSDLSDSLSRSFVNKGKRRAGASAPQPI